MIAITFALPDESRSPLRALQGAHEVGRIGGRPVIQGVLGGQEVLIIHTGMGPERTRERFGQALERWQPEAVLSTGYAGGLHPGWPAGTLLLAENLSTPQWLAAAEAALGEQARRCHLHTSAITVETPQEREALRRATGADAVDMESEPIAQLCRERGIPLLSLRGISDPANEQLAVPFSVCFDAQRERPRVGSLLAFLARHPGRIAGFVRFVTRLGPLQKQLSAALEKALAAFPRAGVAP